MTEPHPVHLATHAMGTRFELVLIGDDATLLQAAGEEAIGLIEDSHRRLSRFERQSVVSEINAAAGVGAVRVDDEVFGLLKRCERYRVDSGGAFSVVFDSERRPERKRRLSDRTSEPHIDPEEQTHLMLDPDTHQIALPTRGIYLDLGGVAKGFALDLAADALREAGVTNALLHGGSSTIVAIGSPPGEDAWSIELAGAGDQTPPATARLCDRAMSVSSQDGDRPGHVIDPRTGEIANGAQWAACIGPSAEETDAWATALVVLGGRPPAMPLTLTSLPQPDGCVTLASNAS